MCFNDTSPTTVKTSEHHQVARFASEDAYITTDLQTNDDNSSSCSRKDKEQLDPNATSALYLKKSCFQH